MVFCITLMCINATTLTLAKDYTFTWSANSEPVEGYIFYYKKGGSAAPPFDGKTAVEGASPINLGKVTTYTITGLDENETYHFTLTAHNYSEESAYADIITVSPPDQVAPPPIITNIRTVDRTQ